MPAEGQLRHIDGMFVGQLDPRELEAFEIAVAAGHAVRDYSGPAGFLGLAKVRVRLQYPDEGVR